MRVRDLNWFLLEEYQHRDDRIVLPIGSTEQHAYLSLETDNILAERIAAEAAEPLGVPVLPVLAYGLTPSFGAYSGSPTLRTATLVAVVEELLDSLRGQGFRLILIVNGHGGNAPADAARREWGAHHGDAQALFHTWCCAPRGAGNSYRSSKRARATPRGWRTSPGRGLPASSPPRSAKNRCRSRCPPTCRRCARSRATVNTVASMRCRTRTSSASGPRASRRDASSSSTAG